MRILVIDDDADIRETLQSLARRMGLQCRAVGGLTQGLELLQSGGFDLVFLDVRLPDGNGLDALPAIKAAADAPEVIILTGQGDPDGAELAIQGGVWDYLVKPTPIKETMLSLQRALRYREEKRKAKAQDPVRLDSLVAGAPAMRRCLELVGQAARSPAAVLLTGETGTGKELFARAIHDNSLRAGGPFIVVDCAALTETLVESTLFGHRKGAFTGADADRDGLVRLANGGTLFLDEVGELPLSIQKTFLRVLQEKRFRPVGSAQEMESDFRLIAATNRHLEAMAERGAFRRDLLFRIKAVHLDLPSLRERTEDIPALASLHLARLCRDLNLPAKSMDPEFLNVIAAHAWPGNVRELFNVLEQAVAASGSEATLFPMHLPPFLRIAATRAQMRKGQDRKTATDPGACADLDASGLPSLRSFKDAAELDYLRKLLGACGGDLAAMLRISGLSRSHFYALLKKHGIAARDLSGLSD